MNEDDNIKEQLASLQRDLGRIEGKFDAVISNMAAHALAVSDHDRRMRSIENRQYWFSGFTGFLGAIIGYYANKLHL